MEIWQEMEYQKEYERCRAMAEDALDRCFQEALPQRRLLEAMRYSLLAGGKRIRPVLALQFCKAACGAAEPALGYACAVEMLHTYSLIHDDLPCMDNDDLRRGKPTCHRAFDEYTAVLAGDALQAAAFAKLAGAEGQSSRSRAAACAVLAEAAGAYGMCGGQQLDMEGEGRPLTAEELDRINTGKTAALLEAACVLGLLAAEVPPEDPRIGAARQYARALGLAFQIQDDILDATAGTEALGKPAGSDAVNGKHTYATLLGLEACVRLVGEQTETARDALEIFGENRSFLDWFSVWMAMRAN